MEKEKPFDLIMVGSGFASLFFLRRWLQKSNINARVAVLERGLMRDHSWQLANRENRFDRPKTLIKQTGLEDKTWLFSVGFGGSSNCWWACVPRMLPNDFRMQTEYGVGRDWPHTYDDLEPYYKMAEEIMAVSGTGGLTPFPRNPNYPQPPHRFTDPDKILKKAYPNEYFNQPTARARIATNNRTSCCANGVCGLCPVDAKFTILNGMTDTYQDPRVELICGAEVKAITHNGNKATGVTYLSDGKIKSLSAAAVGLGSNAIFNPAIMLNSGLAHPMLGKRLHEQASWDVDILLDRLDNFQGSTSITGNGYMLYDGPHRRTAAGCLMEGINIPSFRSEPGRWRQKMRIKLIFEDLPLELNRVELDTETPDKPRVIFAKHSEYLQEGIDRAREQLPELLSVLPIEKMEIAHQKNPTEGHILGTTVMGDDPSDSVIDKFLVHHQLRNVVVLGGSAFPTGAPANPTLTICALSMLAADKFDT